MWDIFPTNIFTSSEGFMYLLFFFSSGQQKMRGIRGGVSQAVSLLDHELLDPSPKSKALASGFLVSLMGTTLFCPSRLKQCSC